MVLAALAAFSLAGCVSLLPTSSPAQLYRFGDTATDAAQAPPAVVGPAGGEMAGVVLGQVDLPRAATGDGILTTRGEEAAYVADARWLAPAQVLFEEAAERAFRTRGAGVRLLTRGETGAAAAVLRLQVDTFEARYPPGGGAPTVVVSLHASLAGTQGRSVAERSFVARQPASENRVAAIVAAYDAATAQVLAGLVDWTAAETPRLAR